MDMKLEHFAVREMDDNGEQSRISLSSGIYGSKAARAKKRQSKLRCVRSLQDLSISFHVLVVCEIRTGIITL